MLGALVMQGMPQANAQAVTATPSRSASATLAPPACTCSNVTLCEPLRGPLPAREVFVFASSRHTAEVAWRSYDYSTMTTLAYFGGAIPQELICLAHAHGVRVVFGSDTALSCIGVEPCESGYVADVVERMVLERADGVNLDIEGNTDPVRRDAITNLTVRIARAVRLVNPAAQVTFDVSFNAHRASWATRYDVRGLAAVTDFIVSMAYSLDWAVTPARPPGPNSRVVDWTVDHVYAAGIPPRKLVMAHTWYGRQTPCSGNASTYAAAVAAAPAGRAPACAFNISVYDNPGGKAMEVNIHNETVGPQLLAASVYGNGTIASQPRDTYWRNGYLDIVNPSNGRWSQIWWDDEVSLGEKYAQVVNLSLRGVGIWTAGFLSWRPADPRWSSMWGAIRTNFLIPAAAADASSSPPPPPPQSPSASAMATASASATAAGGGLAVSASRSASIGAVASSSGTASASGLPSSSTSVSLSSTPTRSASALPASISTTSTGTGTTSATVSRTRTRSGSISSSVAASVAASGTGTATATRSASAASASASGSRSRSSTRTRSASPTASASATSLAKSAGGGGGGRITVTFSVALMSANGSSTNATSSTTSGGAAARVLQLAASSPPSSTSSDEPVDSGVDTDAAAAAVCRAMAATLQARLTPKTSPSSSLNVACAAVAPLSVAPATLKSRQLQASTSAGTGAERAAAAGVIMTFLLSEDVSSESLAAAATATAGAAAPAASAAALSTASAAAARLAAVAAARASQVASALQDAAALAAGAVAMLAAEAADAGASSSPAASVSAAAANWLRESASTLAVNAAPAGAVAVAPQQPSSAPLAPASGSTRLDGGAVAGIAVGAVLAAAVIFVGIALLAARHRKGRSGSQSRGRRGTRMSAAASSATASASASAPMPRMAPHTAASAAAGGHTARPSYAATPYAPGAAPAAGHGLTIHSPRRSSAAVATPVAAGTSKSTAVLKHAHMSGRGSMSAGLRPSSWDHYDARASFMMVSPYARAVQPVRSSPRAPAPGSVAAAAPASSTPVATAAASGAAAAAGSARVSIAQPQHRRPSSRGGRTDPSRRLSSLQAFGSATSTTAVAHLPAQEQAFA